MRLINESIPINLLRLRDDFMAYFRPILKENNITEQQWRIIRYLHENSNSVIESIGRIVCISSPSLTGILTRMENNGFVTRRASSDDKRYCYINLTKKGEDCYTRVSIASAEAYNKLEKDVGKTELKLLEGVLEIVQNKLHKINKT